MYANVYDLTQLDISKIAPHTKFALDTNILLWMHYSRCGTTGYQIATYPQFISDLLSENMSLITTSCNISELLYRVEKSEYDIFKLSNRNVTFKDFRKILLERQNVKDELETILLQLESMYTIHECNIDFSLLNSFVNDFTNHRCDNYDYSILTFLKEHNIENIISDDSDFITYPGINVFTANQRTLREAALNGSLCTL